MSGFRGSALLAIRLAEARSNIDGFDAIVWQHDKNTPLQALYPSSSSRLFSSLSVTSLIF